MSRQKMPDLFRLYLKSCMIGFVLSAIFVGLVMWFDIGGIGRLILGSDMGVLAVALFWVLNGIVFSAVQFAIAVMGLADDDDEDDDRRGGMMMPVFLAEPVPIRVERPKQRK